MSASKRSLLLMNWAVFIALLPFTGAVISCLVDGTYHPNSPSVPYCMAASSLWVIGVIVSFLSAIFFSLFRKKLSARQLRVNTFRIYGCLIAIAVIVAVNVKPVPDYFLQSVGDTDYKVPRAFTSDRDRDSGLNIDICIKTLTGIYDPSRRDCQYDSVYLQSKPTSTNWLRALSLFFQESEAFSLDENQVVFRDSAAEYYVGSIDQLKLYTIDVPGTWDDSDFSGYDGSSILVHLQVDGEDGLVRWVGCSKFRDKESGLPTCEHWVETNRGILIYRIEEEPNFDVDRWQKVENSLLSLISTWQAS